MASTAACFYLLQATSLRTHQLLRSIGSVDEKPNGLSQNLTQRALRQVIFLCQSDETPHLTGQTWDAAPRSKGPRAMRRRTGTGGEGKQCTGAGGKSNAAPPRIFRLSLSLSFLPLPSKCASSLLSILACFVVSSIQASPRAFSEREKNRPP